MNAKSIRLRDIIAERFLPEKSPIAIWCARYVYRGRVTMVGEDFIQLSNCFGVEQTGRATAETTGQEDPIPSEVLVRIDFIEQICVPTWAADKIDPKKDPKKEEALA